MGKYINEIEGESLGVFFLDKCRVLEKYGAVKVSNEVYLPNMVCVIDNGMFAAAGYAYSEREWKEFKFPCGRTKQWYTLENVEKYATD